MDEEKREEEKKEEIKISQKKFNVTEKIRENPWILSTFVLGVLAIVFLVATFSNGIAGNVISADNAGEKVLSFFTDMGYEGLTLDSVKEVSGVYQVDLTYEGETTPIYLTKDGQNLINALTPIEPTSSDTSTGTEIPGSDKPVVELFVMSYCPYGTQAEKGIIPVVNLLGDKIDFKLRFVSYLMHGEKEGVENLREYCIQKIAPEKFIDYMTCFLEGDGVESNGYITNGNDPDTCISKAGIDTGALETCISETDTEYSITENMKAEGSYPKFNVNADLNDEYGVQGSPTLIINGVKVSSSRDPASYLDVVCQAFTDAPEECSTELSSESPSPYFGWDNTGASTTASCG